MAKKMKDIGLGSKPKQPTRKEVFETAYPTFKPGQGLKVKPILVSVSPGDKGFKKIWDEAEDIPRQRFENRIKKNKKTKK